MARKSPIRGPKQSGRLSIRETAGMAESKALSSIARTGIYKASLKGAEA